VIETKELVDYQLDPAACKHWRVTYDGRVATITMDVAEEGASARATS